MWRSALVMNTRFFHISSNSSAKLGKVMKKVMGQTSKKKRSFSELGILPNAEMFSKGSQEGRFSRNARRVSVLNKMFMKYITDLLASGEHSSEFVGHGIEVTKVQISPDYTGLNVFWIAKDIDSNDYVEKLLKKNAGFLRHELCSLRVMGVVPMIHFVKDKQHTQIMELDARLAKADFGEDHIPVQMETKLKTQLELYTSLPCQLRDRVQKIDDFTNELLEEELLPPMPQDIFGLNHSEIISRVMKNMSKSKALHRSTNTETMTSQYVNENPIEFTSSKERREAFQNFLEKRELLRSRVRKAEKNYFPDIECIKQEFEERRLQGEYNFENFIDEKDYASDDDCDDKWT